MSAVGGREVGLSRPPELSANGGAGRLGVLVRDAVHLTLNGLATPLEALAALPATHEVAQRVLVDALRHTPEAPFDGPWQESIAWYPVLLAEYVRWSGDLSVAITCAGVAEALTDHLLAPAFDPDHYTSVASLALARAALRACQDVAGALGMPTAPPSYVAVDDYLTGQLQAVIADVIDDIGDSGDDTEEQRHQRVELALTAALDVVPPANVSQLHAALPRHSENLCRFDAAIALRALLHAGDDGQAVLLWADLLAPTLDSSDRLDLLAPLLWLHDLLAIEPDVLDGVIRTSVAPGLPSMTINGLAVADTVVALTWDQQSQQCHIDLSTMQPIVMTHENTRFNYGSRGLVPRNSVGSPN